MVHTYSGYENKVKLNLEHRVDSMDVADKIFQIVIPTEEQIEIKHGKKQTVQKKVFPGYILVQMDLDDQSWYVVRNTPGVTGFVGKGAKPTPLTEEEVNGIMQKPTEKKPKQKTQFSEGETVKVISGPLSDFTAVISEINIDKGTLKVLVNIFGRETPAELSFEQAAKL